MIEFKEAEILDILPYTFKTERNKALSKAIKYIIDWYYGIVCKFDFWVNISNVTDNNLLDAMAAELDAPFYSSDMPINQKQSIIQNAFEYNRRIGTVSSVTGLLTAAFGGGDVKEWFEYGGEPFHYKLEIVSEPPMSITKGGYTLLKTMLGDITPKRAKLDEMIITRNADNNIYVGVEYVKTYKRFIVPAAQVPDEERGFK